MRSVCESAGSTCQPQRRFFLVSLRLERGSISSKQSCGKAELVRGQGQRENGQEQP